MGTPEVPDLLWAVPGTDVLGVLSRSGASLL